MRPSFLLLLPLLLVLLPACKSTKRAYEQGDYATAVYNSVERLRRSPDNKKARQTLKLAYPALKDYHLQEIATAKLSPNPFRWEEVMHHYEILNRAHDEIRRSPAALKIIPAPTQYLSEYNQATQNAAEARYLLGNQRLELAEAGDREAAKEAYDHYQRALEIRPAYRDAEDRSLQALDLATVYVLIEPIPMHSRTLELSNEFFENQMAEYIAANQLNPFVRFFPPSMAGRTPREPDHIIRMQFDDFVVGQAYVRERVVQRRKDSVVVGTVKVKADSSVNVYGTVEAEMHQFQKQITSTGLLDVRILDTRSTALITQQKFPGTHQWYDYWGFFSGDRRALEEEDERYLTKRREVPNPPPQVLFTEFTRPIFSQVTNFVERFYRNY